jgi:hypothetical protein
MDWIDLAQNRDQWRALVNTVMNLWVPQNVGKFLSFSRRAQLHEVSISVLIWAERKQEIVQLHSHLTKIFILQNKIHT